MNGVIFDVDGTLIDSVDFHAEAWQRAFRRWGKDVPFQEVRGQIGKGGDQLMPVFLSAEELQRFGAELDAWRSDLFKRDYLPRVRAFPGVRPLFERLRRDGRRIVLASSAKADELQRYQEMAEVADLIDDATSSEDSDRSKPCPDIFLAALDLIGLPADEVVVVGDTPYDALAARRAGIASIGVLCGGFPEADLRDAGCDEIRRDCEDLLAGYDASLVGR